MKIGILGAGNIGAATARLFVRAGHEIAISNSRGPDSLRDLVKELGEHAHAMTVVEAAQFGEVVLLAVPWRSPEALPKPELVAGKIVIDAMNPYKPDFTFYDLGDSTSSEETAKRLPGPVWSKRSTRFITSTWHRAGVPICPWNSGIRSLSQAMTQPPSAWSRN
jgi:predicted dinucleotide-binding enzyme